jgi:hypothetical protein
LYCTNWTIFLFLLKGDNTQLLYFCIKF